MFTNRILLILGLSAIAAYLSGCRLLMLDEFDNGPDYIFSVTASMSPALDTISVGDTLYLMSSFSSPLTDIRNGSVVDFTNAKDIKGSIGLNDINKVVTPTDTDSSTTKYFRYVKVVGDIYNDINSYYSWQNNVTQYEERSGIYSLKIGIIPEKSGYYYLWISNPIHQASADNMKTASFQIEFKDTDQHLKYYEDKVGPIEEFEKEHRYCFVVR